MTIGEALNIATYIKDKDERDRQAAERWKREH